MMQLAYGSSGALSKGVAGLLPPLWGAASQHLLQAACTGQHRHSSQCSSSHWVPPHTLEHPQPPYLQQQQQQQQHGLPEHAAPQSAGGLGGLWQLCSASRQQRLAALSRWSFVAQGRLAELTAAPVPSPLSPSTEPAAPRSPLAAAAALIPRAALAAAATAATAAAAPAGASLASFQGSRYTGSSSLSSGMGSYWLRQMNMDDKRVTALMVAANVLCFGMQQVSTTFTASCVRAGFKVAQGEYWRLLTAAFVHGGLLHVGINTLALWNIGRMVEPQLGSGPFLAVYLGSAITGNLLGYWMGPTFGVSMGSSSCLFGMLGAYLASSYLNRHSVYGSRAQVSSVLQTLGINMGLMLLFGGHMDNWAHLGGFLGGAAIGAVVAPRYSR